MPDTYLTLDDAPNGALNVWWSEKQPDRVHVTVRDPRFTDEHGARPGLRIVFSSNPASADYNPASFNRVARALRDHGMPAPDEVPLHSRKLKDRPQVIAALNGAPSNDEPGVAVQDPALFGWSSCPSCYAVVVDASHQHVCTAS